MNTKTKLLLGAVSLICLLSLVFNGILLVRNNSSESEETIATQAAEMDSLKSVISEKDSIIGCMQNEIGTVQSNAVSTHSELTARIKKLEQENSTLNKQISDKGEENKKLRAEIESRKQKAQNASKPSATSKPKK